MKKFVLFFSIIFLTQSIPSFAQYFGKNKPRYKGFDFNVKETPHFDVYYYLKNEDLINRVSQMTEQWYDLHQAITHDTIDFKNPIIFYNNHAEFQQTNTISGAIGVGTGGVTEAFKNRVIMPLTFTNQQTNQVLGHELVHAFQFNMVIRGDSTNLQSLSNLPLWIVEGMAEYMSIGRVDPFTAMWMRDAIIHDDLPDFKKMASPKYFPYRYGQAAWSYLTGRYGDDVIQPLFTETAKYGLETATQLVLGTNIESVGGEFKTALETYYEPFLRDKKENVHGKKLISKENSGRINVSPTLSPSGKYVVFLSEKDLFSTDLFLADARTGEILSKLASTIKDTDLDAFNYLESAGTWSPNSKEFAFVAFKKGRNVIVIKEALSGNDVATIEVPGVPAVANPVWHPNGKEIVVVGLVEGQTDLYSYNIKSGKVSQLTNDMYAEIQPAFSAEGDKLLFSYDKRSVVEGRTHGKYTFDLAVMDYASTTIKTLDVFTGADNLNPVFDHEGNIYFYSDRDGYRNLYNYKFDTDEVFQMTDLLSGISGITRYSPAITSSTKRDRVIFTHYDNHSYVLYQADQGDLLNKSVDKDAVDFAAGTLPIIGLDKLDIVNRNLNNIDNIRTTDVSEFRQKEYEPKFRLDYVGGGGGVGVSNSTFGNYTGLQGGVDMIFSDLLGNNQIFTQLALNGSFLDIGGQVQYLNRKNRLAYGGGISFIPQRTGFRNQFIDELVIDNQSIPVLVDQINLLRIYNAAVNGFLHFPLSTTRRFEAGGSVGRQFFRLDEQNNYYNQNLFFIGSESEKVDVGDEIRFNQFFNVTKGNTASFNVAYVEDNSSFGLTYSPYQGHRMRIQFEQNYGINNYSGVLADVRKYVWLKPVSLAFRGLGYARFENNTNTIFPIYAGNMGFIRGYDFVFGGQLENPIGGANGININQVIGSKIGMFNAELRLPFTGPKQLALIGSNFLLSDINIFFDGGVVFDEFSHLSDGEPIVNAEGVTEFLKPTFASSVGVSARVNLLGAIIVEPYFAWPLQENTRMQFGLNFIPGW
jgi:Tol biopolymer transport system component